jgi:hypothetical protein
VWSRFLSEPVSASSATSVVQEAAGQIVTGTAVDNAGNSTNLSATANLDKTLPELAPALAPSDGATLTNAQPVFLAQYNDSLSGLSVAPVQTDLDSTNVTSCFSVSASEATCALSSPDFEGSHP